MVTGRSRGLRGGAGAPYLAVGRRGSLRVQLTAAKRQREKERRKRGEDKQTTMFPSAKQPSPPRSQRSPWPGCLVPGLAAGLGSRAASHQGEALVRI